MTELTALVPARCTSPTRTRAAVQRNAFGDVVAECSSGVTGEVASHRTDAMSELGNILVTVLYNRTPSDRTGPWLE